MRARIALVVTAVLGTAGCDLIESQLARGAGHCDLRVTQDPRPYCQEWRGVIVSPGSDATPRALCAALGTEYQPTECPDAGTAVGGCFIGRLGDGSASYHWYYSSDAEPLTAADVQSRCGSDPFVAWFAFDAGAGDFGPP